MFTKDLCQEQRLTAKMNSFPFSGDITFAFECIIINNKYMNERLLLLNKNHKHCCTYLHVSHLNLTSGWHK